MKFQPVHVQARERLASGWVYMGSDAAKHTPQLSRGQRAYAISLRRQLAERLAKEASRRAVLNPSPEGREWTFIAEACRHEARRMERADIRLAASLHTEGGAE